MWDEKTDDEHGHDDEDVPSGSSEDVPSGSSEEVPSGGSEEGEPKFIADNYSTVDEVSHKQTLSQYGHFLFPHTFQV